MRLTRTKPGRTTSEVFEGDNATEVLEEFKRCDPYFNPMTQERFRACLLNMSGAAPGPNATDDELLRAVVAESPYVKLEEGGALSRFASVRSPR